MVRVRDGVLRKTKATVAIGVGLEKGCKTEVWSAKIILP